MNIQSTRLLSPQHQPQKTAQPVKTASGDSPPQDSFESNVPFANAGFVGGAVGVASAVGAVGHSVFGAGTATALAWSALPVAAGLGVGLYAARGAQEEFNGHPVLTAIVGIGTAGAAAVAAPILATPGAAFGWKGAAVATVVGALGAGIVSAVGMHYDMHREKS